MVIAKGTSLSPPGKPTLTGCRSPEKETFTCWWRPGSDGGLPTTYTLFYLKENSDTLYECPDYHTAGENSCFFNKNVTSVWVNYNITVVATNKMGRTSSDPVDVDVAFIVQPHTPENVTVNVMEDKGWPFLRVSWESPHKADIRSGWITLVYELRSKMEGEEEWEENYPGQQKTFNIYSIQSGSTYHVQVRCRPDHGFWSEWSTMTKVKVPEYFFRERSLWILIIIFASFIFLILTWIVYMNSHSLKHCLLPPVPGPKIKGFDQQLLQNGSYKDGLNALMIPDFPPTPSSNYEDLLVEYLEVFVPGEELSIEEGKNLQDRYFKSESSTFDNDSGRGSCDSHTLAKEVQQHTDHNDCGVTVEPQREENVLRYVHHDSPDMGSGRVKTWPSVFSSQSQYTTGPIQQKSSIKMVKQHCLSDTLFPSGSISSNLTQFAHNLKEPFGPNYWEFGTSDQQPFPIPTQTKAYRQLQAHSNINIYNPAHGGLQLPPFRSTEYVEVKKVKKGDLVLLQPAQSGDSNCSLQGKDYSKVKAVDDDNILLLESGMKVMREGMDSCFCEGMETNGVSESCYISSSNAIPQKNTEVSMPVQEQTVLAPNGYVDTATMFTMPMY